MEIKKIEKLIVIVVTLLCIYMLYSYNTLHFFTQFEDSAGFVDLIRAVIHGEGMVSPVFTAIYSVLPLLSANPTDYCDSSLHGLFNNASFSTWHAYFFIYLLKPFALIFNATPASIAAAINAGNLILGLTVVYLYLRTCRITVITSILFIFAIIAFPLWIGDVNGQYYFDRLFFFPGLVLMFYMAGEWQKRTESSYAICSAFFLSAIISERIAIISSIIALTYWLIDRKYSYKNKNVIWLVLGITGLVYTFIYMHYFQNSFYYSSISFTTVISNLKSSLLPDGILFIPTLKWLIVISPFLLLALFRLKYAVIVIIALAPNLFVTIGGAEKIGFTTHYHSVYLPILIGLATINFSRLFHQLRYKNLLLSCVAIFLALYGLVINISEPDKIISLKKWHEIVYEYHRLIPGSSARLTLKSESNFNRHIASYVPPNASVSTIEELMPAIVLNGNTKIDFLPIGIGTSDCVYAIYEETTDQLMIPSYRDNKTKGIIAKCIQTKIEQMYSLISEEHHFGRKYSLYCQHKQS